MKKLITMLLVAMASMCLNSCVEQYSKGERVGTVTKFSKAGVIWDSWDGHLNLTQTGMNSAGEPFAFSFDNDRNDQSVLIQKVEDAQRYGWKIKISYHEVWGMKNVWRNRGESDYFVDNVEVLDTTFAKPLSNITAPMPKYNNDSLPSNIGTKDNPLYIVIVNK